MRKWLLGLALLACAGVGRGQVAVTKSESAKAAPSNAENAALRDEAAALLSAEARELRELRPTDYRLRWQTQMAALLWRRDEKEARALYAAAAADWQTLFRQTAERLSDEEGDEADYSVYQQIRYDLAREWAQFDGVAALAFIRATRPLVEPYLTDANSQAQESALMADIAGHVARQDPKEALKLAQESLANGVQQQQLALLQKLREKHPSVAQEFAGQLYSRLKETDLLNANGANYVAAGFLQQAHDALAQGGNKIILNERDLRAYAAQVAKTALSVSPEKFSPNGFSPETYNAYSLVSFLAGWEPLEKYAPGRRAELKARAEAWQRALNRHNPWQEYYERLQDKTLADALPIIADAPPEMRENLYLQAANKAAGEGRIEQARQVVNDYIKNPQSRDNALRGLEQAQLNFAVNQSDIAGQRAVIARLRSRQERFQALLQLANQFSNQQKNDDARAILEEARSLLPPRPVNQDQLYSYFALAQTYAAFDIKRAFDTLEPLLEQFNDLCVSAERVDGFLGQTYRNGEFLPNGSLGNYAQQIALTLSALAGKDFTRTRKLVTQLQRPEVRIAAALAIGQNILATEDGAEITSFSAVLRRSNARRGQE
jgi:hypothetical protein